MLVLPMVSCGVTYVLCPMTTANRNSRNIKVAPQQFERL
jgi:hypothetical protein